MCDEDEVVTILRLHRALHNSDGRLPADFVKRRDHLPRAKRTETSTRLPGGARAMLLREICEGGRIGV